MATLFTNITDFKLYTTVQKNTSWDTLLQFVKESEERFLLPLLDTAQYNAFIAAIPTLGSQSAIIQEAINKARRISAKGAMYIGYPQLWVTEGDMGVQQNRSRENTSEPATNTAYFEGRRSYLDGLTVAVDSLLDYLQTNQASFSLWVAGKGYTQNNSLLIRNNAELGRFLNTADSIRAYVGLKPFIQLAEQKYVEPIVPSATLTALKAAMKAETLTTDQKTALQKIRKVVAWYAFYEALPFINIRMEGTAITVAYIQDGITKNLMPSEKDKERLSRMANDNAELFYQNMITDYETTTDTVIIDEERYNDCKPDFWT